MYAENKYYKRKKDFFNKQNMKKTLYCNMMGKTEKNEKNKKRKRKVRRKTRGGRNGKKMRKKEKENNRKKTLQKKR